MYHRGLIALRGDDANLQAGDRSRCASRRATGNFDTSGVTEWAGKALPPRVAAFQKDFITKYMDPTEIYARMDSLATQFPDIIAGDPRCPTRRTATASGDGDDGGHDGRATCNTERRPGAPAWRSS